MSTNLDRYMKDLDSLLAKGERLSLAMQRDCFPGETVHAVREKFGDKAHAILKSLPSFTEEYQLRSDFPFLQALFRLDVARKRFDRFRIAPNIRILSH